GQLLLGVQRVQAVGVDAADHAGHRGGAQGGLDPAAAAAHVVAVHGLGEQHVGGRVEALGQLGGLVVEVALHRPATTEVGVLAVLRLVGEAGVELGLGAIGQV